MNNLERFLFNVRGKTLRLFMKEYNGEYADYVNIVDAFTIGDNAFFKVHDVDGGDLDFRIVRVSDIDTIEYYSSDEVR